MIPIMHLSLYGDCAGALQNGKMPKRWLNNKLEPISVMGVVTRATLIEQPSFIQTRGDRFPGEARGTM